MKSLILVLLAPALLAEEPSSARIRSAAVRSIALLQQGQTGFYKTQDCFSCHNTGLPAQALELARQRGIPVDEAAASAALIKGLSRTPDLRSIDRVVQATMIIDLAVSDGSALIAAHATGLKPSLTTAVEARLIANTQRADGHWVTIDQHRPQSNSEFTATALAVRAIEHYMPEELRREVSARAEQARAWLLQATPQTTEDFTFRLFGLAWTNASDAQRAAAVRDLLGLQRADGGWAQLPRMAPDAYATAEVLVALNQAGGVPTSDPAWRKGLQYLMSTQNPDGSWHVRTRMVSPAHVSPPYFESGFPFGHDQFISCAATSYAAMALMLALPPAKPASPPALAELEPQGGKPWMQTALFGTAAQLKSLLDGGLDPNSHTEAGTSLLMMAAPDPAKLKLLLDRGVDVNAKAKSGYTALMIASLYRGSGDAVQLLLSKGGQAAPGPGVMFNASPISLATYAGEAANISLLHSKGGDVNRSMLVIGAFPTSPLSLAISFGEVEVMKTLIAAGANIKEHDPTDGMSLLHSAVLENRLGAAQLLIAAGVPVNDVDNYGYTPLLYASTVDFGDDRMVKLLLHAGADPKAHAKTGETALSQAKRYKYPHIQTALETSGSQQ